MNLKSYIAIFFTVVFFGKSLMIDTKFLVSILDAEEMVYINPFCDNKTADVFENGSTQDLIPASKVLIIPIDSYCNAPFQFQLFGWTLPEVKTNYQGYNYTSPEFFETFRDKFYPPPQV
ncbi:hypothetical protein [Gillisia limnaea]|nr:hypothetical protein [Gillisia limnaea]